MRQACPSGQLNPVLRLKILSEAMGSTVYAEKYIPAPYQQVWGLVSDLERQLPRLITGLTSFQIVGTAGNRLEAQAVGLAASRARFDVVLDDGWCLMQSRVIVGGMAALPEGDGTRLAVLGGLRNRYARPWLKPLRPVGAMRGRVMISKVERQLGVKG
jgi:hypothetical protein